MKSVLLAAVAVTALSAKAQTTTFSQVQHIQTALNHLTVIDVGEPVVNLAVADPDAFEIERHDDKVFLKPLRTGVATNLFIWTPGRQLNYEIDPAGELTKMNVVVRDVPQPIAHVASAVPSDLEIERIASLVLTKALMGTDEISRDGKTPLANNVHVELTQVFRSKSELYIRYTIVNQTKEPFRITSPDVYQPAPTQTPISMLSLRNHQISAQTFASFKPKQGSTVPTIGAESRAKDLAPGERTTGVISIRGSQNDPPQIYQLRFGSTPSGQVTAEVVI
jgi:hypothetical protein